MALNFHGLPVYNESVSAVTATPSVELGSRRIQAGEEYVYVYNDGGANINPGNGCVMSGNTGMSVTVSSTTFFNACIGVVKHATLTTGTYGWVMTRGFSNLKMHADSSGIVGNPVYLGLNGTFVDAPTKNTATTAFSQVTSLFGIPTVGVAVQATASAGTAYGYVRCFG